MKKTDIESVLSSSLLDRSLNPETWRIEFDGQSLIMRSGKYQWSKIGFAKNALWTHLKEFKEIRCYSREDYESRDRFIAELIEEGRLRFVKIL
jgi:hypothetical protein